MKKCKKCRKEFPGFLIIDGLRKTLYNRKFCLECSPYLSGNRKDISLEKSESDGKRMCPRCKNEKSLNHFYTRRSGKNTTSYCKSCISDQCKERHKATKEKMVEYKGGACQMCGYNKCIGALDFHHRDMTMKEFSISYRKSHSWINLKEELDKCDLLCCRCHREVHLL
jgi:hypothetical protein